MFNKAEIEIYEVTLNDVIVTSEKYPGEEGIMGISLDEE